MCFDSLKLPNGVTYHTGTYQDRLGKLQEHLRQLSILFRKLRLVYDKCNENCAGLDPVPIEVSIFLYLQITDQTSYEILAVCLRLLCALTSSFPLGKQRVRGSCSLRGCFSGVSLWWNNCNSCNSFSFYWLSICCCEVNRMPTSSCFMNESVT